MDTICKMKWVVILVMFTVALTSCQKVQMTRTALHVARSLDPNSMEEMSVKTKNGDTATIIVKKRNGRHENLTQAENSTSNSLNGTSFVPIELIYKNSTDTSSLNIEKSKNDSKTEYLNEKKSDEIRVDRSDNRVPNPVLISSSTVFVKGQQDVMGNINKRGRGIIKLDQDGIPIITGVRVHDDESDRLVWRNARVINGTLVPYDKSNNNFITKLKPIRKPISNKEEDEGWTKLSSVTKKPSNTLQIVNTANLNDYPHHWNIKNKPVVVKPTNGVEFTPIWMVNNKPSTTAPETVTSFTEKWDMVNKPTLKPYGPTTSGSAILHTIESAENDKTPFNYMQHPLGIWVAADKSKNPDEHYVTDKILEYIRNINKEEVKRLSLQPFTARDARTISRYRTPRHQPAIQSRILQNAGNSVFQDSPIYSPSTSTPSRVSFEEGVRTPVLQYAHPEYGVQSTKALSQAAPVFDELDSSDRRDPSLNYFGHDVHADRSPFAFEPGLADQVRVELPGKKSHPDKFHPRPKKTLPYFYNDLSSSPSSHNKYAGRYPERENVLKGSEFPGFYYEDIDNRPFWIKFGDQIKEHVQTGIEKVSDYTKPIMAPLMEATSKISQNLGFSKGNRDISAIRERLGLAAPSSLILPAIGIVAGGAALGLGAVAVGRYLNYEVVRMRSGKSLDDQSENGLPIFNSTFENTWVEDKSRSGGSEINTEENPKTRRRRNIFDSQTERYEDETSQNLENTEKPKQNMYPEDLWSNTPCSKKVFCEVMVQKSSDSIPIMEKRIVTFLSMIDQKLAILVAPHLEEVMSAIRRSDCSSFKCDMKFTHTINQT